MDYQQQQKQAAWLQASAECRGAMQLRTALLGAGQLSPAAETEAAKKIVELSKAADVAKAAYDASKAQAPAESYSQIGQL